MGTREGGAVYERNAGALERCLADAGWNEADATAFVAADHPARLRLARRHRRELLEGMHATQRQIDCTDYLLHELEGE